MKFDFTAMLHVVLARLCGVFSFVVLAVVATQASADEREGWHYNFTPYLWLPNVNARLSYRIVSLPESAGGNIRCVPPCVIDARVGPNSYLANLKYVGMVAVDARKGRWGVGADLMYMNLTAGSGSVTDVSSPLGRLNLPIHYDTSTLVTGEIETLNGSYSVVHSKPITTDVLVGFRTTTLIVGTDWNLGAPYGYFPRSGTISKESEPFDLIVGAKGRGNLSDALYIRYYFDVGAGKNSSTAQEIIGIGFSHNSSLLLAYRNLAYTSSSRSSTNQGNALTSAHFSGPALGYSFRF
jgi:hypothetical protein